VTPRLAFAALLMCPALAACGGSDSDRPAPPPPRLSDAEQAAATVRRQMQAVARGDGATACGLFSPRALEQVEAEVNRRAGSIGCATAVEQGAGGLSGGVRAALRRPAITRVAVRGDRAAVQVRLPAGLAGRRSARLPLRRTTGGWRVDGLPPL
jgi:hypothetical protein